MWWLVRWRWAWDWSPGWSPARGWPARWARRAGARPRCWASTWSLTLTRTRVCCGSRGLATRVYYVLCFYVYIGFHCIITRLLTLVYWAGDRSWENVILHESSVDLVLDDIWWWLWCSEGLCCRTTWRRLTDCCSGSDTVTAGPVSPGHWSPRLRPPATTRQQHDLISSFHKTPIIIIFKSLFLTFRDISSYRLWLRMMMSVKLPKKDNLHFLSINVKIKTRFNQM